MLKISAFWIVLLCTILSWASWYLVLTNISPFESPQIAFPSFYISLFFSLSFTFGIIFSLLLKIFSPTSSHYSCLKQGIREGILAGIGFILILIFLQFASISWKEIMLIVSFLLGIEIIFIRTSKLCY